MREGISGTASITKSTEERESIDVDGVRRERISSDWDWDIRSLVTSLARSLSGKVLVRGASGEGMEGLTCEL